MRSAKEKEGRDRENEFLCVRSNINTNQSSLPEIRYYTFHFNVRKYSWVNELSLSQLKVQFYHLFTTFADVETMINMISRSRLI